MSTVANKCIPIALREHRPELVEKYRPELVEKYRQKAGVLAYRKSWNPLSRARKKKLNPRESWYQ